MHAEGEPRPIRRVERFLERLFADPAGAPAGRQDEAAADAPARALLAVDDAGAFLLCGVPAPVLGHARGGRADLPVLADVGREHARFEHETSLQGGLEWRIVPLGRERSLRNVEPISGSASLSDGDALRLGGNLDLVFRLPDPASATALLELQRGADCLGASRILCLVAGPGGRVRLGAGGRRHVVVPGLAAEVEIELVEEGLRVASTAGLSLFGGAPVPEHVLPFPPPRRQDVTVGGLRKGGRPPFALVLAPAAGAPPGGGTRGLG